MEKIVYVRREAKRKVFVENAVRALKTVAPDHNLRNIPNVVLVGGSAEDFEIPEMLTEELANYRIVCGRGTYAAARAPEMQWLPVWCSLIWEVGYDSQKAQHPDLHLSCRRGPYERNLRGY